MNIYLSIDDIYDLFTWDAAYSPEEYDTRVEQGIAEAVKLKNLFPFIQPVVTGRIANPSGNPAQKWLH